MDGLLFITVPGKVATKGSWRVVRGNRFLPANDALMAYCDAIRAAAEKELPYGFSPLEGVAITVGGSIHIARPKSHWNARKTALRKSVPIEHIYTPDLDKIQRAIGDALEGVLYKNDSQIVAWDIRKYWDDHDSTLLRFSW